jgi:hypothetical protein
LSILFAASLTGCIFAVLTPALNDWLLLALPCLIASALAIARQLRRAKGPSGPRVIVDGSNVMHWHGNAAKIETLQEVVSALIKAGYTTGVMFDANAGYKLAGRYMNDRAFAKLLKLPQDQIMVVPKGMPADPLILEAAHDYKARIVSNDQFRDWADDNADVLQTHRPIRGTYKGDKLVLSV